MSKINNLQKSPPPHPGESGVEKLLAALPDRDRSALLAALQQQAPAAGVVDPRPPRRRRKAAIQYLTDEELGRLFRAVADARNPRDLAIFELAYHRGLRASEVGLLDLKHLRLDAKRLFVTRAKNGNSGEYMLTEREVAALRSWLRKRGKLPGPLFPSRERRAITRSRLDQLIKSYGAAAALPAEKRHFHCLRHSCATSLIEHDVGIEDVQDHLGHRHIANTQIYAKITSKRRTRTGEKLYREW